MSTLCLELKQGEVMILNGATIRFKTRARIELNTKARFLFGKQIMPAEDATTLARQIYYEIQTVYIGCESARQGALPRACALIGELAGSTGSVMARELLGRILNLLETGNEFEALKLARQIVRHEAANGGGAV
jgi:flagellar protein FlbT